MARGACLAALLAAGCAAAPTAPSRLAVAVPFDVSSLDPQLRNTVGSYELLSPVYEPLTGLNRHLRVVPRLAASWENPNSLTWVFRLRPGVVFHSGRPLAAKDVVYSLRRPMSDERLEVRSALASVAQVEAPDSRTVIVRTKWPNAQLAARLHQVLIVPDQARFDGTAGAAGTGPYRLTSWKAGERITLERHERYWGPRPPFEGIDIDTDVGSDRVIAGLARKQWTFVSYNDENVLDAAERAGGFRIVRHPSIFLRHLAFDLARVRTPFVEAVPNPFRDPRVREAIDLALDRPRIAAAAGAEARPANQLVPRAVFGFDPELPQRPYDLDRARRLMAEAGLARGFKVTLHRSHAYQAAANEVKSQLAGLGIDVEVVAQPSRDFFAALDRRELSFWITGSGATTGDALELLELAFHSPDAEGGFGVDNYGGYRNAILDGRIREAAGIFDTALRKRAVQALLREVQADRIWIPLYFHENSNVVGEGLVFTPRDDGYLDLADVAAAR